MVKMDSELFHAACDIMRTRDAQLEALGDDELMHDGRKGMKWGKNIFTEDEEKKRRENASSGQSQYAKQLQAEANRRRYGGSAYNDSKPERPPIPAASRLPEEPEPITGLEKRFDNSASAKADYYRNKYGSQSSSSTPDDVENGRRIREQQRAQREAAAKYAGSVYTPGEEELARYKKSADIAKKPYEARERANQIRDAREHDRNVLSSDKFSNANVEKATSNHEVSYTTPSGNRITKTQEMPREPQYYKDRQSRRAQNDRGEDLEKLLKNIDLWKQKKK